ncbi:MAG: hypothetical protein MZV63_33525 [Marinilabiliales bacterium]|nr:hypothetical protein [Marinilabiliales bacterium]
MKGERSKNDPARGRRGDHRHVRKNDLGNDSATTSSSRRSGEAAVATVKKTPPST